MKTDPYRYINETNFDTIKDSLEWGINNQKTPVEIAALISKNSNLSEVQARALVQEELIGAMGFMKDGDRTKH